jgi:hypothetical protein
MLRPYRGAIMSLAASVPTRNKNPLGSSMCHEECFDPSAAINILGLITNARLLLKVNPKSRVLVINCSLIT